MPKRATVRFQPLQTCLVNLPLSIYGQLVSKQVRPQSLVVCLSWTTDGAEESTPSTSPSNGDRGSGARRQQRKHTAYVGWSGMPSRTLGAVAAAAVKGEEAIEIDPVAARELGLPEHTQIFIDLLRNLPAAKTVSVEPVSIDDWEIVELHAEYVEQNLLSQVRAASPGQILCVWVGKARTLVRFRVDSVEPAQDIAVRLTVDTEVVVAPKTRKSAKQSTERHRINGGDAGTSTVAHDRVPISAQAELARKQLLRALPDSLESELLQRLASENAGEYFAWVHPHHFRLLLEVYPTTKVSIRVKDCPACPSNRQPKLQRQGSSGSPSVELNASPVLSPLTKGKHRALNEPNGPSGADSSSVLTETADVHLQSHSAVPQGAIWLSPAARKTLNLPFEAEAFELIKLSHPNGTYKPERALEVDETSSGDIRASSRESTLAGIQKQLKAGQDHIRTVLTARLLSGSASSSSPASSLLICGASGSGKSSLAEAVLRRARNDMSTLVHAQSISCSALYTLRVPQIQQKLEEVFTVAAWHAPSVVLFDDLDKLSAAEVEHIDSFRSQHISHILLNVAGKAMRERPIIVVATAKGPETLHACLRQTHFFGERITLSAPNKVARQQIMESVLHQKALSSPELRISPSLALPGMATKTEGYLPVDLRDLVERSIRQAAVRASRLGSSNLTLDTEDLEAAQQDFTPLSLRDIKLQKSEVNWADIGGLHETRRVLRETLEWPTKYGAIFASSPLRLRSGLLLYGYPGCGKTLLASAVAKECGLNFITVKGPEILNKYIGASEKSVRDLFERAQSARPCVLFFDEFDSIAPKRGHDSTGVTDRVVNQMLTQMDGAEGLEGVYVLAATSRPDLIDPALLRPGRLDKSLLCDMPGPQDRLEIMQACARKIALSPEVDLEDYVDRTEGYSGADLQALIYNAHLDCIHAGISASREAEATDVNGQQKNGEQKQLRYVTFGGPAVTGGKVASRAEIAKIEDRLERILASQGLEETESTERKHPDDREKPLVEPHHLEQSLKTTRPSVPKDEVRRLQRIYSDFVSARAKGGLPDGSASQEIGGRSSLM